MVQQTRDGLAAEVFGLDGQAAPVRAECNLLELGDQTIADDTIPESTGKDYFTKKSDDN